MKRILSFCSFILVVSIACFAPAVATPISIPTMDLNQLSTLVVETAQALALSATATNTNIPTDTPSETPTFTSTVTNKATFTLTPGLTNTFTQTPLAAGTTIYITNTFQPATSTKIPATKTKVSATTAGVITITSTHPVSPSNTSVPPINITATPTLPTSTPTATPVDDPQKYVNYYRGLAGVPLVSFDTTLGNNCWEHARYMAENDDLTHDQNSALPYASDAGQICAQNGNAWIGGSNDTPYWKPSDTIDGWMESVGHRLWLLYPTTPVFGYGFYTAGNNIAAAGLDVISRMNDDADLSYANWPVRYPAPNQSGIPAINYNITLNWRYFGTSPTVTTTSLITSNGTALAHTVSVDMPAGHKGIVISPSESLPPNTTITVSVSGSYDNVPFQYTWSFTTGN